MDIREFLEARLAEDEAKALAAKRATSGRWRWDHGIGEMCNDPTCPYGMLIADSKGAAYSTIVMEVHGYDTRGDEPWNGSEHIARHDPARVLRDVEAKRRILAAYVDDDRVRFGAFESCSDSCPVTVLDEVVKLLALPYDIHPDYDESWRP